MIFLVEEVLQKNPKGTLSLEQVSDVFRIYLEVSRPSREEL